MKVPVYDSPQVREAPLPNAALSSAASPDAFGGITGRQLSAFGDAVSGAAGNTAQIIQQQNELEDTDTLLRAESALKDKYRLFDEEVQKQKGVNAWGITKKGEKWWEDTTKELAPKFKTQRAGQMYSRMVEGMRLQSLSSLGKYETTERNRSLVESANASIVANVNWAAANPTADSIRQAEFEIVKRVDVIANVGGLDKDVRDVLLAEKVGTLHKEILSRHIVKDATAAKAYYESNKDKFPGADRPEIEAKIDLGRAKQAAPIEAKGLIGSGITMEEALKEIRSRHDNDPNLDVFEREVKQVYAEREAVKREKVNTLVDRVNRDFATRWRPSDVNVNDLADLKAMDGSVWAGFKAHMEQKIKSLAGEGSGAKTDYKTYDDLYNLAGTDPQKFATTNLWAYRAKLKDSDYEEMKRLQLGIRNSINTADAKNSAIRDLQTTEQQFRDVFGRLGWGSKDADKMGQFRSIVIDAINTEAQARGRPLTATEREEIIGKYAVRTKGRFFGGSDTTVAERIYGGEQVRPNPKFSDVSPSDRARFVNVWKQLNDAQRKEAYARMDKLGLERTPENVTVYLFGKTRGFWE